MIQNIFSIKGRHAFLSFFSPDIFMHSFGQAGLLTVFAFYVSSFFSVNTYCQSQKPKPNIIVILADDMGYGDLNSYGATGYRTPYIDKLAAEGMRFTNFYAGQAVCSASRAALLSGCYPNRIGITGALFPRSKIGFSAAEEIIPENLKKAGYKTAIVGKWHLGDYTQFLPLQHGFDQFYGLPYSNDMWGINYDGTKATEGNKAGFPPLCLMEGNKAVKELKTMDDQDLLTTLYTEKAIRFIEENRRHPFFLYLAHSMPHVPLGVSSKFKGKSNDGLYGDVMMELDWSVGEVMKALERYHLSENTVIIFTSDNGPWLNFGNHAGSSGGLREGKSTSWEGGQRVPCIVRWPGKIKPGQICEKMASNIDFLPTFSAIAGTTLPANKIDGVNILPLLLGEQNAEPRKEFYYYFQGSALQAVRKGNWKLVLPHNYSSYEGVLPGKDGKRGERRPAKTGYALYNMRADPGERYDVKDIYPDVMKDLLLTAEKAREDLGDDLQKVKGKNVRKPGIIKD